MHEVTLKMLTQYLEQFGWSNYQAVDEPFEKEGVIRTGWRSSSDEEGYQMAIDPMVEKSCLCFRVTGVLTAPLAEDAERVRELTLAIGFINYNIILGKFAYDPRDGEVRFSVDVPIDENTFTYAQFLHVMRVAIESTELYAPKLHSVWSGEITAQQFIDASVGQQMDTVRDMMAGVLRQLLEALERNEGTSKGDAEDDDLREV